MKRDTYFVYILSNEFDTVFYTGITNNLERRTIEHREGLNDGFTKRYHVHKLIYYETYQDPLTAIQREKKIKGLRREKKIRLIKSINPTFIDLLHYVHAGEIPPRLLSGSE